MIIKSFRNCLLLISFSYFFSCQGFNRVEHIVGPYYLIEIDIKEDLSICYDLKNDDYLGKIPQTIIEYGYNDSFLIAKTKNHSDQINFYIVDIKKDSALAHEEDFRFGPMSESEFVNKWEDRLKIRMKSTK